ncbi:hypothetical protein GCM10022245_55760 [Streptomyces mayteni]
MDLDQHPRRTPLCQDRPGQVYSRPEPGRVLPVRATGHGQPHTAVDPHPTEAEVLGGPAEDGQGRRLGLVVGERVDEALDRDRHMVLRTHGGSDLRGSVTQPSDKLLLVILRGVPILNFQRQAVRNPNPGPGELGEPGRSSQVDE